MSLGCVPNGTLHPFGCGLLMLLQLWLYYVKTMAIIYWNCVYTASTMAVFCLWTFYVYTTMLNYIICLCLMSAYYFLCYVHHKMLLTWWCHVCIPLPMLCKFLGHNIHVIDFSYVLEPNLFPVLLQYLLCTQTYFLE